MLRQTMVAQIVIPPSHGANTHDQEPFTCPGTSKVPDVPSAATTSVPCHNVSFAASDGPMPMMIVAGEGWPGVTPASAVMEKTPTGVGGCVPGGALKATMNGTLYGLEHMENPMKPMALISARVVTPAASAGLSIVTRMSTSDPETGPGAVAVG